ncbi:glutamate receptor ionotropic, NMDA 2C-like [Malaya genurostris]|uniref:glutamate receptor ionotropic, NMDA 2C-like n=1 Tax=Malaya genurostris TaxID=325434 RepID=UPI0026F3BE87|nr:glutamate receptor ionotropic, NMDA 2C-like [Malaya genurostris]
MEDSEEHDYNQRLIKGIDLGCDSFVMDGKTAVTFLSTFITSHDKATYKNPIKPVIIVQDPFVVDDRDNLDIIRKHPVLLTEIPLVLILEIGTDQISLLTHRFVSSTEEAEDLILLDTFSMNNESFSLEENLFPDKTRNLNRKMYRLASFRIIPHFVYTPISGDQWMAKYKNQTVKINGMGGLIMVEFCRKHNCTWDIAIDQEGQWGMIFENGTGDGIIGTVYERRADVGVGSLLLWENAHWHLGFSSPIRKVGISCIAPRPHMIPSWQIIGFVFAVDVWIFVAVCIICCSAMYLFISHVDPGCEVKGVAWNALNVWAIVLFQAAEILHNSVSQSVLSIALLIFAINLGNIFAGKNASLRTFPPFEPPIDTLQDLAERDIIWIQTHEAWVHSLQNPFNAYLRKIKDNFRIHLMPEIKDIADEGRVAIGVSRLNYGYNMIGDFITDENVVLYRLMKEDLYHDYEVSMTTKTWPLREQLSDLILRIVESGVRSYQEPIVAQQIMNFGVQTTILHSRDREQIPPTPMNCNDMLGSFMLLGAGIVSAILVFIGELLMEYYKKRKLSGGANVFKISSLK